MPHQQRTGALQEGDLLAAVDVGSNSFHMIVARYTLGQLRIVDKIKEMVMLASGLQQDGALSPNVTTNALACLARFGQRLRAIPPQRVRVIATNTVRQLKSPRDFLDPAEAALGHGIEVVSGREEARLVYLGVAHGHPPGDKNRLVIDIGGGSSEFIIGNAFEPIERESLQMGCIATTRRYFADGKLNQRRWRDANTEMAAEFQQFASKYHQLGWQECYGSSGTIKQIGEIAEAIGCAQGVITKDALDTIVEKLLEASSIEDINLPDLAQHRRVSIVGGILVLFTSFSELSIHRMNVSRNAMREGILYDLIGRGTELDPRDSSVAALVLRYATDEPQALRVAHTALSLFDQIAEAWQLCDDDRAMLAWAARLHEIGLAIAHSQYHQHGAYLLENSDIAGFSNTEQQILAALIRNHRRALYRPSFSALPDRLTTATQRIAILLRLAALLHRGHDDEKLPKIEINVANNDIGLKIPKNWLQQHPLTLADIETERNYLQHIDYRLNCY